MHFFTMSKAILSSFEARLLLESDEDFKKTLRQAASWHRDKWGHIDYSESEDDVVDSDTAEVESKEESKEPEPVEISAEFLTMRPEEREKFKKQLANEIKNLQAQLKPLQLEEIKLKKLKEQGSELTEMPFWNERLVEIKDPKECLERDIRTAVGMELSLEEAELKEKLEKLPTENLDPAERQLKNKLEKKLDLIGRERYILELVGDPHSFFMVNCSVLDKKVTVGMFALRYLRVCNNNSVELDDVYIDKSFRALGLGGKIIEESIRIARAEDNKMIFLDTLNPNLNRFYQKFGSHIVAESRCRGFPTEKHMIPLDEPTPSTRLAKR